MYLNDIKKGFSTYEFNIYLKKYCVFTVFTLRSLKRTGLVLCLDKTLLTDCDEARRQIDKSERKEIKTGSFLPKHHDVEVSHTHT